MAAPDWKLRDARNRRRFALRMAVEEMAADERELDHGLHVFAAHLEIVKHDLDEELRREHWGREPERLPSWRSFARATGERQAADAAPVGLGIPDATPAKPRAGAELELVPECALN
jgi:hypothetical protein